MVSDEMVKLLPKLTTIPAPPFPLTVFELVVTEPPFTTAIPREALFEMLLLRTRPWELPNHCRIEGQAGIAEWSVARNDWVVC